MSLKKDHTYIEVYNNIAGGHSLVIADDGSGYRLKGTKVTGSPVAVFEVSVEELITAVQNHQGEG